MRRARRSKLNRLRLPDGLVARSTLPHFRRRNWQNGRPRKHPIDAEKLLRLEYRRAIFRVWKKIALFCLAAYHDATLLERVTHMVTSRTQARDKSILVDESRSNPFTWLFWSVCISLVVLCGFETSVEAATCESIQGLVCAVEGPLAVYKPARQSAQSASVEWFTQHGVSPAPWTRSIALLVEGCHHQSPASADGS